MIKKHTEDLPKRLGIDLNSIEVTVKGKASTKTRPERRVVIKTNNGPLAEVTIPQAEIMMLKKRGEIVSLELRYP